MGSNSDRFIFFTKFTPYPNLRIYTRYQITRKGDDGTIYQQYLVQPQPPFLFNKQNQTESLFIRLNYEFLNNIYFNMSYEKMNTLNNQINYTTNQVQMGISLGL
jgi:hypothetical protein